MKRVVVPELLDSDTGTPREVEDSLKDLQMINRRFGGAQVMSDLLHQVAVQRRLESIAWLDVAGASGDIATLAQKALGRKGVRLEPILLDRAASHLSSRYPSVCSDALVLPFRDGSLDVIGCSLFAHHLEPKQITQFAIEALRVARHAVVISDLIRHRLHLAFAYAGWALYRSRLTRHDAPASVRRAYTVAEMKSILQRAGASGMEVRHFYLFRMGVILWKKPIMT
ncbi:MAG TPA: methyltransferase domain-containing protein [Candidatus Solibacter sp.]|nr:methyltransferase domain-containing protein [Candidatus Solibacter sp.]